MKTNAMKVFFAVTLCLGSLNFAYAQSTAPAFSTEAELKNDVAQAPCKNDDRLAAVKTLFSKMGATETEITIEKLGKVENLVVTKKGKTGEIVVIGAHYDKTADGCGAIDNWTGIVILANLYRTMKPFVTNKTFIFVAFGKEEIGLIGSNAMAKNIPKEKRTDYCAMVNFDSFGFTYPQALRNISDERLMDLAEEVSKEMKIPFAKAGIDFASSDSESFRLIKIPAISLHGLSNKWTDYLHSSSDKVSNVNSQSVYLGYRHGLVLLSKLDNRPCASFRK